MVRDMIKFDSFASFRSILADAPNPSMVAALEASERNKNLTKPFGSLGRLEELAVWYTSWRGSMQEKIKKPQIIVFAANHGVAIHGISAFPQEVTAQMVKNFHAGGAAINQLAEVANAKLDVIEISLDSPTKDFTRTSAMSEAECLRSLEIGWRAVNRDTDLLVVGEMGIGNTTSAAAVSCALFGGNAAEWTGRGTGLSDDALEAKTKVVDTAVKLHQSKDSLQILSKLGGRELAAMVGAIARARVESIPVCLDGFICTAAAACLFQMQSNALDHAIAGHLSAEGGHEKLLSKLEKEPLLSLGLRLGEGSGAAVAIHILNCALSCHSGMATFAEAGVST
ncbi:MAG: nicotinate-nucleotide--dimethylbenzimidazole phosphoribosyltransferase [Aestuariivita sp.]|nr:nicotinate-nucleotide--dimethylbenzimidazole phosphoribosyltransferase [Aestuariivita sp.]